MHVSRQGFPGGSDGQESICNAGDPVVVKNMHPNAGDIRDVRSIPGSERSPGGGHGNLLQYSCPENPMDREARRTTVHRVAKGWTRLKQLCMHAHMYLCNPYFFSDVPTTPESYLRSLPSVPSLPPTWAATVPFFCLVLSKFCQFLNFI